MGFVGTCKLNNEKRASNCPTHAFAMVRQPHPFFHPRPLNTSYLPRKPILYNVHRARPRMYYHCFAYNELSVQGRKVLLVRYDSISMLSCVNKFKN